MEERPCKVWNKKDAQEEAATIRIDSSNGCEVTIIAADGACWKASADDPLTSLNSVRRQMEIEGFFPLCCGARLDVAASGMARGARATRKVYRLELGKQALRENLVDIFDPAEKENVSTLQEQRDFYEKWLASLG